MYLPKDFVLTQEGLMFAVVAAGTEEGRVLGFLRYVRERGQWRKVNTDSANVLLADNFPQYLFHSIKLDASLHGVPEIAIAQHLKPAEKLHQLLNGIQPDPVSRTCVQLCELMIQNGIEPTSMGVTGSLLGGMQHAESDIDLVFYSRKQFDMARSIIKKLLHNHIVEPLDEDDWRQSHLRRDCDLTLQEYIWHEQRKFNKVMFQGRKVDLNLIVIDDSHVTYRDVSKVGSARIQAQVIDASQAFDYPAVFKLDHPEVSAVVCFTATYTGQAEDGEWVEIAGQLEQNANGEKYLVVGSTREARGEFIKVMNAPV